MHKRPKASLLDVAKMAGCSPATVSRVMNNNESVGEEVRNRVLRTITQLGYVPNGSARALRSTQTRIVGAVIPTVDHAIYASMIEALQVRLAEKEMSLILSSSMYDTDLEYHQVRQLIERGAEAIVLVGAQHKPQTIEMLEQHRIAYVQTYTTMPARSGVSIGFDNYKGGRIAARFLLELGHRSIAMIAGVILDNDRAAERVRGFLDEAQERGIPPESVPVIEASYSVSAGANAMERLMQHHGPTAVFCGSDILAAGAVKCCHGMNISVPEHVTILGFDNLQICEITVPELTTLEVPAREMGRLAADYVTATPAQRLRIEPEDLAIRLIVRGSSGQYNPHRQTV